MGDGWPVCVDIYSFNKYSLKKPGKISALRRINSKTDNQQVNQGMKIISMNVINRWRRKELEER